ncbi:MAG: hypothetical protein MZV63_65530 [Marinilabiliales bacterium]|nr:hypothetical protein [Marinilabiliales bacterium]
MPRKGGTRWPRRDDCGINDLPERRPEDTMSDKKKVLIIDDDPAICRIRQSHPRRQRLRGRHRPQRQGRASRPSAGRTPTSSSAT